MLDAPLIEDRPLEPGFTPAEFSALWDRHGEARSLILVGHEPDLSELISLPDGREGADAEVGHRARRGHHACAAGASCNWLLRPKQLRLIASARVTA